MQTENTFSATPVGNNTCINIIVILIVRLLMELDLSLINCSTYKVYSVLALAGVKLFFLTVASVGLGFGFVLNTGLII